MVLNLPCQLRRNKPELDSPKKRGSRRTGLTGGCSRLLSVRANADSSAIVDSRQGFGKPHIEKSSHANIRSNVLCCSVMQFAALDFSTCETAALRISTIELSYHRGPRHRLQRAPLVRTHQLLLLQIERASLLLFRTGRRLSVAPRPPRSPGCFGRIFSIDLRKPLRQLGFDAFHF